MISNQSPLVRSVMTALYGGAATTLLTLPGPLLAQDEEAAELERIEVTGSRIKRADIEGAQPVFVIQREDIERTGLSSVGDLLQDLPSSGSALNVTFNNGGNGATFVDLRNLGSNRVLVLVNGRRWVTSLGGSVDLNNVPIAVVKRIEVLRDGASAVYGSDAIAGVINIITRDDFTGMQVNAKIGEYDEGDGQEQSYDFSVGASGDRSNVFFNVSYVKSDPIFAGARVISQEPQFGTGNRLGSSGTPFGRFFDLNSFGTGDPNFFDIVCPMPAEQCQNPANFRPWNAATDAFNFAPDNYLLTPQERTAIYTQGRYDLTDSIAFQFEASYTNRESSQLLAPTPLFIGLLAGSGGISDVIGISGMNPFNPFGVDIAPGGFFSGRRQVEAGPRVFAQDTDAYRFGAGFVGSFEAADRFWDWNVNYVYGKIQNNQVTDGLLNLSNVQQALGPGADCTGSCVPLNLFGTGGITPAMQNYILFTAQDSQEKRLRNYTANITGDIWDLPAGPLGFAAGFEYRQEEGFDQPDAIIAAGITSGNSRSPTSGSFSVDEFYVEFAVPLLADRPGVEILELNVATRYSDYDLFGDTTNSKFGFRYQPFGDLLIRGTYSEGFRGPSISEAFLGQSDSFPTITDPCSDMFGTMAGSFRPTSDPVTGAPVGPGDPNNPNPLSQAAINNCIAQGVDPSGNYSQINAQIRITVGGNPNLIPEEAESITFGFVYSPSYIDGLDVTVDYFDIELTNSIATVGAQTILNACAGDATSGLCQLITRSGQGTVIDLFNGNTNIGGTETKGVDITASYAFPETSVGYFKAALDASYLREYRDFVLSSDGVSFAEIIREGQNFGLFALPRWKANLDFNWTWGNWDATYGIQYLHSQTESCAIQFLDQDNYQCSSPRNTDPANPTLNKIGATTYHDVQVSYNLQQYDTRVTVGVDNVWDKGPPISTTAFANSFDATVYRVPGRFGYVRLTVDF